MKKKVIKVTTISLMSVLLFGSLINVGIKVHKEYKKGDYVASENAYFDSKIDDPAGLIKAHKFVTPTDNKYSSQKTRSLGSGLIGDIESVWSSYTGKGTTVAIIDDGFDYNHPEYKRSDNSSAILSTSRYYYTDDEGYNVYYQSYSTDPTCIAEDWESTKWATHGTNTSTTAAAPMGNGGGVGIAPDADILALKIDFSFGAIRAAIDYAIDQKVDVINMSLGAYSESFTDGFGDSQSGSSSVATYLNSVCQKAYNAGIIVIAAAGNEATWHKSYPACNTKVIGVGAIGDYANKGNANKLAEFTNYVGSSQTGEINVDILAPGYVYTAKQGGTQSSISHTYGDTQGTSFSSPIVAGAACLWKEKYPNGTPDEFLTQLQSSADGIGSYTSKMVPVSGWDSSCSDVGPSNITNGRLNVANLMEIDDPYVSTVQSTLNISVGESHQIDIESSNGTVTYTSNDTSIATVSNSGLVEGKGAGTTTITVTATKNDKTATTDVTVNVAGIIAASSVSFNPKTISLEVGETYNAFETITTTPSDATKMFLFDSNNDAVAMVDEDSGYVTAIGVGSTTIDVVAIYGTGSDSLTVNVTQPVAPTSWNRITSTDDLTNGDYLIVYENGNKAFNGGLDSLDVTNNYIDVAINSNKITYSSETEAAKVTINAVTGGYSIKSRSGYYIGRENNSNGLDSSKTVAYVNTISFSSNNATITGSGGKKICYNTADGQNRFRYMSSGGTIQLYKANSTAPVVPTVTSVTISPSTLSLYTTHVTTGNLSATVNGTNSPAQTVTWESSNTSVATVSSSGVVTAKGIGNATIIATSTVDTTKSGTCTVTVSEDTVTGLEVTCSKTFHPGDTISKSDLSAQVTYSSGTKETVTNFSFANDGYQFKYSDAPSGGTSGTKELSVTYNQTNYIFNVNVSRVAYQNLSGSSDTLTRATTGVGNGTTDYTSWSGKKLTSNAVYAGVTAGDKDSIQLRSKNSDSGIFTTASGGILSKVSVTWNSGTQSGRTLNIYGKHSAYTSVDDLYNSSKQGTLLGTIVYGTSTELTISGEYEFVGVKSDSGALYLTNITFTYAGNDTAVNVSNYIMYEDKEGQCTGTDDKLNKAIAKLNSMSNDEKSTFWTSNDYVINTARERLEAWARHEGKTLSYSDNTYVVSASNSISRDISISGESSSLLIWVIISAIGVSLVTGYFLIRKKKG